MSSDGAELKRTAHQHHAGTGALVPGGRLSLKPSSLLVFMHLLLRVFFELSGISLCLLNPFSFLHPRAEGSLLPLDGAALLVQVRSRAAPCRAHLQGPPALIPAVTALKPTRPGRPSHLRAGPPGLCGMFHGHLSLAPPSWFCPPLPVAVIGLALLSNCPSHGYTDMLSHFPS